MKISIIVKANARVDKINLSVDEAGLLKISVKAPAKEGKANEAVVKLLAEHFKVPKSNVIIKSGLKSKNKIVEIE